jgi:hypothetical protein
MGTADSGHIHPTVSYLFRRCLGADTGVLPPRSPLVGLLDIFGISSRVGHIKALGDIFRANLSTRLGGVSRNRASC